MVWVNTALYQYTRKTIEYERSKEIEQEWQKEQQRTMKMPKKMEVERLDGEEGVIEGEDE